MLVRDLRSPWIRHALAVDLPAPASGRYSWPAQRSDGSGPPDSIPEGARLTNAVADLVGDEVLMYASDYPHGESHFPESARLVTGWDMAEGRKRKLLWDNAVRLYARARPLLPVLPGAA